jgi:hypothetical protein
VILRQVAGVLARLKVASASELAAEAGADREMVDAAIDYWIHRGNVIECSVAESGCGTTCRRCPLADAPALRSVSTVYEWVEDKPADRAAVMT